MRVVYWEMERLTGALDAAMNGNLGVAFGARGKGGKNAGFAHYEPSKIVINLTKMSGAGSLAHEWGHALDDYFGSQAAKATYRTDPHKGWASQMSGRAGLREEMQAAWGNLMSTILERQASNEETVADARSELAKTQKNTLVWVKYIFKVADKPTIQPLFDALSEVLSDSTRTDGSIALRNFGQKATEIYRPGKKGLRQTQIQFEWLQRRENAVHKAIAGEIVKRVPTSYRQHANNLDTLFRKKPYFSTVLEIFARAFESYVQDKTTSRSQYLVHGTQTATSMFPIDIMKSIANFEAGKSDEGNELPINMYPAGEERDFINAAFDNLFQTMEQVEDEAGNVILQMAADEDVEFSFDSLYTPDGEIDYEQVQNAIERIFSGEASIQRLKGNGEQGRIDGGRLLVGSSLIVGGGPSTSEKGGSQKRRNNEEDLLEAYAKSQNAWIDDIGDFKRSMGRLGRGMEAEAYKDGDWVVKVTPIPHVVGVDSSILRFFDDKIALHNSLPHAAPYELVAFTRDLNTTGGATFQESVSASARRDGRDAVFAGGRNSNARCSCNMRNGREAGTSRRAG